MGLLDRGLRGERERLHPLGRDRDRGIRDGGQFALEDVALIHMVLSVLDDPAPRQVFLGLLRSAVTDGEAAGLVRDILTDRLLLPIARGVPADRPELRAAMVGSQVVGIAVARHVVALPAMASASRAELVAALAPAITHYLEGQWDVRATDG